VKPSISIVETQNSNISCIGTVVLQGHFSECDDEFLSGPHHNAEVNSVKQVAVISGSTFKNPLQSSVERSFQSGLHLCYLEQAMYQSIS
jgi:hypothetical protein